MILIECCKDLFLENTMTSVLLQNILQKIIYTNPKCRRLLSKDGITATELVIDKLQGIFEGAFIDVALGRNRISCFGNTLSIAKNLDEYQFIICCEIPSVPDTNPSKLQLQKCRIGIIASFARLALQLNSSEANKYLEKWNSFAKILLVKTFEWVRNARTNDVDVRRSDDPSLMQALDFFGVPERDIEEALADIYHYQL